MNPFRYGFIFLCFLTGITCSRLMAAELIPSDDFVLSGEAPVFILRADNAAMSQIILEIRNRFGVTFTGLEGQMEKRISLSCSGSLADIIQKLLKASKVKNCALTFDRDRLTQVIVFPVAAAAPPKSWPLEPPVSPPVAGGRFRGTAVEVRSVIQGTQAEQAGLEPEDIIIAYNGHRIIHARNLISQIKKDKSKPSASLVILREGNLYTFDLKAGFIGITVFTVPMDVRELKAHYKQLESG